MINYDNILAGAIGQVKPSAIRKFFDILADMKDAISLGIGEPDFVTPYSIRDAGIQSLERGHTKYSANAGMTELRREISRYLARRFDLEYDPAAEIIVTVGGSEAIDMAIRTLVDPGDEVIVPEPTFVCYSPLVTLAHGVPVPLPTRAENGFAVTPEDLERVLTDRTKAMVLPYPNNPTGGIMNAGQLDAIAQMLRERDIMVISDEIYAELTYSGRHVSIASLPGMRERTIVVNGFSKSHAMTGWRMGYVCAPAPVTAQMAKVHQYAIMCAPTVSQYAAIEAMRNCDGDVERMRDSYNYRRRLMVSGLQKAGLECFEPQGAFYAFPSIRTIGLSSEEFCERLLLEEKVAAIPGNAFGDCGEGYIRCCYATAEEDIIEALKRIRTFVDRVRQEA